MSADSFVPLANSKSTVRTSITYGYVGQIATRVFNALTAFGVLSAALNVAATAMGRSGLVHSSVLRS